MAHLPLLFWLKWTLVWRGYRRNRMAVVGMIISLLFIFPFAVAAAGGSLFGYLTQSPDLKEQILRAVLLAIYAIWLLAPVLGFVLNESYDITRLFVYPLSSRQIFLGVMFGSLVDFPVLFFLPTLLVIPFGFAGNVFALLVALLVVPLFLLHTLALSQAILLVGAGFLRSRRFRDLYIMLMPLLGAVVYLLMRVLPRYAGDIHWRVLLHSRAWEAINLLPPGLAARTVAAASRGAYGLSLLCLLGLLLFSAATVFLAGRLIEWIRLSDTLSAPAPRQSAAKGGIAPRRALGQSWLPPVVSTIMDKEMKYLLRDPYYKAQVSRLAYLLIMVIFIFRIHSSISLWSAVAFLLWGEMAQPLNFFGTEGNAASTLFLFPSARRQILLGKNLFIFTLLAVVNGIALLIITLLLGKPEQFPLLYGVMELLSVLSIACGNVVSVKFPYRAVMRGWRMQQQSAGRGCGYSLVLMGAMLLYGLLALPVVAALALPMTLLSPAWFALAIPVALAYVFGLYYISLHVGTTLLRTCEIEIAEKLTPD